MKKTFFTLLLVVCSSLLTTVFSSCHKEKISLTFTELPSNTTDDLNNIFFINDSIGYVCGGLRYDKGDILKTTDGGFTWHDQSNADMIKTFYKITFPSIDTGYACGYEGGKIFRTFNGGNNWEKLQTKVNRPLRDLFMLNSQKGFCCGGDGFKTGCTLNTSDAGNSWSTDTSALEYRCIFFFNDLEGVIAGYGAIQKTTNGGESWSYTNAQQDFFVSMSFANDQVGYAVGYTGSILKTTDGGKSWDRQRNSNSLFQSQWFLNRVICRNENVAYIIGEHGCFLKTEDGGDHWNKVENTPDIDLRGIALVKNGGFVCGVGGKIYRFIE